MLKSFLRSLLTFKEEREYQTLAQDEVGKKSSVVRP
jgi:hypothetical protein